MAFTHPCATCPWRPSNKGKPHVDKWYSKANLRRLWSALRRGEKMSCHHTDPRLDNNLHPVAKTAEVKECAGGAIVQQREFMRLQPFVEKHGKAGVKVYLSTTPRGLTRAGAAVLIERHVMGRGGLARLGPNLVVNLNEPDIAHDDELPKWEGKV